MIDQLALYQVDPVRGFLPAEDPLENLPLGFEVWERIATQVPALLMTEKLRYVLENLVPLDISHLENERQLKRAMLLLSVFGTTYVRGGANPVTTIPRGIAIPWWGVAEKLGRPPMLSHASAVLENWRRLDKSQPLDLNNIASLQLFLGGLDEQWFYQTAVAIEFKGVPAIVALVEAQKAVVYTQVEALAKQLKKIATGIADIQAVMLRIPEKCDPYIFYHRVRPFLGGWTEPGLVYEGVSDTPKNFTGGSAAQSSLIQSLDAGLGIKHQEEKSKSFLLGMRTYMPPAHRKFIEALESSPSVREFVFNHQDNYPVLCDLYNECVSGLNNFRKKHMELAGIYILRQAPQDSRGAGGTKFVDFLKEVKQDTKATLLI
jgi:indoleamine 2,3-dioxygenase